MYIKEKEQFNDHIEFKISPVFTSQDLVKRARDIVDDYFTFVRYETLSKNHNFGKYCLTPIKDEYRLVGIEITELLYAGSPFCVKVHRNGSCEFFYPENISPENKDVFNNRFERCISYAL